MGLSQRELSQRSGLTQAQISRIENGAVDMRISSLLALARELGLELNFAHQEPPPRPAARRADHLVGQKGTHAGTTLELVDAPCRGIFGDIAEELL
jgi:transcriptional regulator with XRE-family HTH domain